MAKRSPREYARILKQYSALMEEIKRRQAVVDSVLNGTIALPRIVVCELCYLQLRFICELIALACLTAHEDIEASTSGKLRKAYAADWIIGRLETLHPGFYPQPGKQILNAAGRPINIEPITEGYLSKIDLLKLYHECGVWLHRGSLKGILSDDSKPPNFETIKEWSGKLVALLNHHQIQLVVPDRMIWVLMNAKENGRVSAHLMEQIRGPYAA